ncbi:MAG: alpha/beta hydrolase-fold protein [Thermoguttaceae bacterium]
MPRIRHSDILPKNNFVEPAFEFQSGLFCPASQDTIHALFAPLHYERGYPYPLIVWLHGQDSDERQLRKIMPLVSMRNYVAVAPRGVCMKEVGGDEKEGYGWPHTYEQIPRIEQHIFDAIEAASRKFNICSQRIFLAGFDSGGTMAFRVALNHPQHFAGILSICGAFPIGRTPLANLSLARKLPILLCVGRHSTRYPAGEVCENLRLMHTAGISVTLRQYPCGHELMPQMLGDIDRWIIEQITSTNAESSLDSSLCSE